MNVQYIEENKTYVITSHTVARNNLFTSSYYCNRFLVQFEKYMSRLCKLRAYNLGEFEFTLVVTMKERDSFERYFTKTQTARGKEVNSIPASTYIFSQAIANLLSSIAIHYNRKEGRTGALFARRFQKILLSSDEDVRYWTDRIHEDKRTHFYEERWRWKENKIKRKHNWYWNSRRLYGTKTKRVYKWLIKNIELQGQTKINSFFLNFLFENQITLNFTPP